MRDYTDNWATAIEEEGVGGGGEVEVSSLGGRCSHN